MKICRECSNVCESDGISCPRCGSTHLVDVQEKLCAYCKSRIAVGTIICPHCHRVLPPESQSQQKNASENAVVQSDFAKQKQQNSTLQNITFDCEQPKNDEKQPVNMHIAKFESSDEELIAEENAENAKNADNAKVANNSKTQGIDEFDKQNPLFGIYDSRVKSEKQEAIETQTLEESESAPSGEIFENSTVENRQFETGVITHVNPNPQSRLVVYGIFLLMIICNAVALWTIYMTHAMGDVLGYEMSAAVFINYRDVFPSIYPYILYGSNLLSKYELLGSHLPFAMNFAMMFAFVGGVTMMVSAIPKWISATFNGLAVACHLFGIYVIEMLFGFRSIGISAYIYAISALAVFALHLILVRKD